MFSPGISEIGGAARHTRLLAEGFLERGWEIRILARAGTLRRFRIERTDKMIALEVPGFGRRRLGALLYAVCAIPIGFAWAIRARAVFALQILSQALCGAAVSSLARTPFLALTMSSGEFSEVSHVLAGFSSGLRRRAIARADFLIAQNQQMAEEMEALVSAEKIQVVRNPLPPINTLPLTGEPRALYLGRLSEEKNLLSLLDAWGELAAKNPSARLTLAGVGGTYLSVEHDIRKRVSVDSLLKESVDLPGWVEDVEGLLRASDVYVLPSRTEGLSNGLLEACVAERVVVASDIPANREVLGDSYPLLFDVSSKPDLLEALQRALYDGDARDAAIAIIRGRMREFSADDIFIRFETLLDRAD